MLRSKIINLLIEKINAKKYLEIGISDGNNFLSINCEYKVGVDPDLQSPASFHGTSDEFFNKNTEKFDVIFIDGLHHADQVYKDITNSLQILNKNGYIICHDMNPEKEEHQTIPYNGGIWNGDCWKAFVKLRSEKTNLEMYVIDTDYGCGIICNGRQKILSVNYQDLTWDNFIINRKEWLNLISIEDFLNRLQIIRNYNLKDLLNNYIFNPENPEYNFDLALYYHNIGQTASAVSYYLRTAERTLDDLLKYECLIRASMCFDSQGTRNFTVKGFLLHALAICPKRPEAYYLMSKFHEKENKDGSWNESYTISSIGLEVADLNPTPLKTIVEYPGNYSLLFQKANSSWWCGLCEESRDLFLTLLNDYQMSDTFRNIAINNLKKMNIDYQKPIDKIEKYFDWGLCSENNWFQKTVEKEIFIDDIYQKFFKVEEGDIVFDVGASVGPFTYKILSQNPAKVYCFEPHTSLYSTLLKNVNQNNVVCINKLIGPSNDEHTTTGLFNEKIVECFSEDNIRTSPSIKFSTFVKENNIDNIDFLKTDCEGGEYDIFNDENFEWIKTHVGKIAGEWHLITPEQKDKFRKFRDTYLKEFENYYIFSIDNVDIKFSLWDEWFIQYYGLITIYIDNSNNLEKKSKNSFNWGIFRENKVMFDCIQKEFSENINYEKLFPVESGDIVVDIGASVGPFVKSILSKNPKQIICLEPHYKLYQTLNENFLNYSNVLCINKGISSKDGEVIFENLFNDSLDNSYIGDDLWKKVDRGIGITFKSLIKENSLTKIDFLKTDCEGGEYDIFTIDNFYWIKNNVRKIAGEWHIKNEDMKKSFIDFRDFYIRKFDKFKIFFIDMNSNFFDITNEVWDNNFVSKYGWMNIYIDNR